MALRVVDRGVTRRFPRVGISALALAPFRLASGAVEPLLGRTTELCLKIFCIRLLLVMVFLYLVDGWRHIPRHILHVYGDIHDSLSCISHLIVRYATDGRSFNTRPLSVDIFQLLLHLVFTEHSIGFL